MLRKTGIFLLSLVALFLLLGIATVIVVNIPTVQNYCARKTAELLSEKLNTEVKIGAFKLTFSRNILLEDVLVRDYSNDTMIAARKVDVHFSGRALLRKEILVKGIALEGAYFHLQKDTNGKLNLNEVFSLKKSKKKKKSSPLNVRVEVQEIGLLHTHFDYTDKKGGTIVRVNVGRMLANLNDLGLASGRMNLHSLTIVNPIVDIVINPLQPKKPSDTLKPVHFMIGDLKIDFGRVLITNAQVLINNIQKPVNPIGMDYNHLDIRAINLNVTKGTLSRDTIIASIRQLSAREKCGLVLSNLRAEARVTPNEIECKKLMLQTPGSQLSNYVYLQYSHFNDFTKFITKVRMKGDFKHSKVALKDVNFFAKKLHAIEHNTIQLAGKIDGRVNNLRGRDMELKTGSNTYFKGNFFTYGLPDVFETSLNLRVAKLTTNVKDIQALIPSVKIPENIARLGNISFTGNLDGFLTDIFSQGKFNTAIGSATTDLNFRYNKKTNEASYKGNLALHDFDLGKFTGNESMLGTITAVADINGKGLKLDEIEAQINGTVKSIFLKQYNYRNATVNGVLKKRTFVGKLCIHDENIDFDFDGMANLNKAEPEFNFTSTIRNANLKALNLSKQELTVGADLSSNITGKNIDDIAGTIVLRNLRLANKDTSAFVDFVQLQAYNEDNKKKSLFLKSKVAEAEIEGHYSFSKLIPTLKHIVERTFTENTAFRMESFSTEEFSFAARIYEPGVLTQFIHPDFKLIRNSKIQGTVSSRLSQISLNGFIPELQWGKMNIQRTTILSGIIGKELDTYLNCDNIYVGDSLMVDSLQIEAHNEINGFLLKVFALDKHHKNKMNLTADLFPQSNSLKMQMRPSEVWLSDKLWQFSPNNEIEVSGKKITSKNFVFASNEQSISLDAYLKNDTSTSFNINLNKMVLSDFTKLFMPKDAGISAEINGVAKIEDIFYTPSIIANVVASNVKLGEVSIGNIALQSELEQARNRIVVNTQVQENGNDIRGYGYYSLDRSKPELNLAFDLRKLSLDFLNYPYFKPYVKNTYGTATGKLRLQGVMPKLALTGSMKIDTAATTVSYLNTRYSIRNQEVLLTENNININHLIIQDINNNEHNKAIANGKIYHSWFKNFGIDLRVNTFNAMMLNTDEKLNPVFYGKAFAAGSVNFKGLFNDLTIRANVKTMPGTHVNLPIRNTKETSRYSFFQFVDKKADSLKIEAKQKLKLNGLTFILELEATPDGRIDIVLDPVAGDILSSIGKGNIKLEIPKAGNVTMYGTYEVAKGDYLFTLQNIINKRFQIEPGGSINFTGDIYQAQLNVDAVYSVRTSTYDLISDFFEHSTTSGTSQQSEAETRARSRIPVKLLMKLSGVLAAPNVAFDIRAIDPDPSIKNLVENRLQIIRTNETELNKEVFGLLVMNRFLPPGNTLNNSMGTESIGGGVANTLGEFVSSQLSLYLNNFFSNFVNDFDVNFGYRQYNQQGATASGDDAALDTRRELQLALTKRFFNDRLSLSAGGNVDFGNTTVIDNTGTGTSRVATANVAGDFQLEYKLDKEGTWRAKVFNRTDYDNFNLRNRNRTGVGITFRKDFDKFKELFKKKKKKKKAANTTPDAEIKEDEELPETD